MALGCVAGARGKRMCAVAGKELLVGGQSVCGAWVKNCGPKSVGLLLGFVLTHALQEHRSSSFSSIRTNSLVCLHLPFGQRSQSMGHWCMPHDTTKGFSRRKKL